MANRRLVHEELEILAKWGFPRWTLLVVPAAEPDQLQDFQTELMALRDHGHELALHGFRHKASPDSPRSMAGRLALRLTGQEAEFAGLSIADSRLLLEEAIRAWDRLGLGRAEGFVPPTWHAPEHLADLARAIGWSFYEERFTLHLCDGGWRGQVFSVPVSFAGLPKLLFPLFALVGRRLIPAFPGTPRLVLHPGEVSADSQGRIRQLLEVWGAHGTPLTYGELARNRLN